MGAEFLDLPDEVLVLIVSRLRPSCAKTDQNATEGVDYVRIHRLALCTLALMNRRLHNIVYPILLEDVKLSMLDNGPAWTRTTNVELAQIHAHTAASLEEVKIFQICWNSRTPDMWAKDLFETLATARDLAFLIVVGSSGMLNSRSDCIVIESLIGGLANLRIFRLDVDGFDMTASLFNKICDLPQLASFRTISRIYGSVSMRDTIASSDYCIETNQNLEHSKTTLSLLRCSGEYCDLESLRLALSRSPELKELQVTLPGPGVVPDFGIKRLGGRSSADLSTAYRPALVTRALLPASSTLERFVCTNHEISTPFHDGSVLDLSSFHKLESVEISVRLLCKAELYHESHRHEPSPLPGCEWFKNLPSSLEELEIHFDYPRGLLWNKADLESLDGYTDISTYCDNKAGIRDRDKLHLRKMHSDFSRRFFELRVAEEITTGARLRWVKELVEMRFECLSSLKTFEVIESCKIGRRQRRAWGHLDLAAIYPETFGCPDLGLEILVRTPQGYIAPPFSSMRS